MTDNFSDMLSKAKLMQEKMKKAQDAIKDIQVEGESGGSYQRPELSKMVEIKSSLAEIFKSLKSIKRPNSLDSDNIEMFTPAAFQAKPSKGTLSHLIHTIDFHKIIVGKDGKIVDTFASFTKPTSSKFIKVIEKEIRN